MTTQRPAGRAPWRMTPQTVGDGVYDPMEFLQYTAEKAISTPMYGGDPDVSVVIWNLEPGQERVAHSHPDSAHVHFVLTGSGEYVRDKDDPPVAIKAGQVIIIPRGVPHDIRNTGTERLSYLAVSNQTAEGHTSVPFTRV